MSAPIGTLRAVAFAAAFLTHLVSSGAAPAAGRSAEDAFSAFQRLLIAKPDKVLDTQQRLEWIDDLNRRRWAAAVDFYQAFPSDPRRWSAIALVLHPQFEPLFTANDADRRGEVQWNKSRRDLLHALMVSLDASA